MNYQIGYELHKAKQPKEALYYYKRSIELGNNDANAYLNLSKALYECGNLKESLELAKRAQNKFPNDNNLKTHFNELYNVNLTQQIDGAAKLFEQQKYNEALNAYNSIQVKNEAVLLGIAGCKFYLNDLTSSINYYKKST
ncbi:MAG: tetratricopeptide repeat protein [Candidatus Melainabacteria bacterium]|nr:MAG: tetratricopeptide repeat protein [Candidatus Melainabacteria bacterium]